MNRTWLLLPLLLTGACNRAPDSNVDPAIAQALAAVKAIDNHAHPVRPAGPGESPDTGYDALPVENLEPASDLVRMRPGRPEFPAATKAIFGGDRAAAARDWGANYAATVLDKAGIDKMVANRVAMGPGLPRERFLWAGYVDALMYPFPTEILAVNSDRKAFFALEAGHLARYYKESGVTDRPGTLDEYLEKVVTATLERHKQAGAVAEKFEMAYLRTLAVGNPSKADAEKAWNAGAGNAGDYRTLQDFLFRFLAQECGRLGLAVHIHTGAGGGGYFDVGGSRPGNLEPVFNDPALRKTNFVMLHGGWPYSAEVAALLTKPNVYVDFSVQGIMISGSDFAANLRGWLEAVPEKVLFGTDAYPFAPAAGLGWEEMAYVLSQAGREALGAALTRMVREGSVSRERAIEIGKLVLRENAAKLYGVR